MEGFRHPSSGKAYPHTSHLFARAIRAVKTNYDYDNYCRWFLCVPQLLFSLTFCEYLFPLERHLADEEEIRRRLTLFFDFMKLRGNLQTKARAFASKAKKDPTWATYQINQWMLYQKKKSVQRRRKPRLLRYPTTTSRSRNSASKTTSF